MNLCSNLDRSEVSHFCLYFQKQELISSKYKLLLEQDAINHDTYIKNKNNLIGLKEHFSSRYELIIQDLTKVIECISSLEEKKKSEKTEEDIEESPAGKPSCLNLCWMSDPATQCNVINVINDGKEYYWCVKSEEVLFGPFICKISVDLLINLPDYWNHTCGIIKEDGVNNISYYNDSILMNSNGYIASKFSGSGAHKIIFDKWKTGDELIIKRDHNNSISFGLNDENNLKEEFFSIEGNFRIVMGFCNSIQGDKFSMKYLQNI